MQDEEFKNRIRQICDTEMENIKRYFLHILNYIDNCSLDHPLTPISINAFWDIYQKYYQNLIETIAIEIKKEPRSQQQKLIIDNLKEEIYSKVLIEGSFFKTAIYQKFEENLSYMPIATLIEQMDTHEIFPDSPAYYQVSF